ncbi:MAG: TRAP transporter small permease subunit [Gammaproteobacteria bacterium]|nr:TRAP transporter small permease subunit [Gammaproteobacteria bacterium]
MLAGAMVVVVLLFLLNNYLIFWRGWPGFLTLFAHHGWLSFVPLQSPLSGEEVTLSWLQFLSYLGSLAVVAMFVLVTRKRSLRADASLLSGLAAYIVRAAFWAVVLVGLADMLISFLRVEGLLQQLVGAELTTELGRSRYRGAYVHYPLIALSLVIAIFVRTLGFIWLALLVVVAEFQIVISRFIFSYEQAFMGDLVRFWYAALFLFASAYSLIEEGHVRVDVFYTHFTKRGKAWTNALGSVLLGIPLCWVILTQGMWGKGSSINSPLLSFEISQSGFGMYVKYLMAGFLVVFAVSMIIQFSSYFLSSVADLRGEPDPNDTTGDVTL